MSAKSIFIQKAAMATWIGDKNPSEDAPPHALQGVVGEIGELYDHCKKKFHKSNYGATRDMWLGELGDLHYYTVIRLTEHEFELPPKDVIDKLVVKLSENYELWQTLKELVKLSGHLLDHDTKQNNALSDYSIIEHALGAIMIRIVLLAKDADCDHNELVARNIYKLQEGHDYSEKGLLHYASWEDCKEDLDAYDK